jgi:thioester reductase-like protein
MEKDTAHNEIAIIGMSARFPGAGDVNQFWRNLRNGVESIRRFSDDELRARGVDDGTLSDPDYVKAGGPLEGVELFDASFFGYSPRECQTMDPQQRLFLECAWEALENGGYNTETYQGRIGVYGGMNVSTYLLFNICSHPELLHSVGGLLKHATDKDYIATRVSYKLNLTGASFTVQAACSTSLIAVHLACQSLLSGENDMALAGAANVILPQDTGYAHVQGGIESTDGHCRAFDAGASGTVFSNGVGIVLLKRLADAVRDGDYIYAVIKGTAINNDGMVKIGYTAPSVTGQSEVIAEALAVADVDARTISYVEAHGTGTALGDPIEVAALTRAYRSSTQDCGYCALGSVKTNIGHTNTAAGAAGLIKTALALKHGEIPPSLHFRRPNPEIGFAASPFFVNTALRPWPDSSGPRRAGVSAFGIGGTNVHLILEEAPEEQANEATGRVQVLVLSAKTPTALATAASNLADYLAAHPENNLADVAYTLQVGRREFAHRRAVVCADIAEALAKLQPGDSTAGQRWEASLDETSTRRPLAFMFPGQGTQHVGMGQDLYEHEPVFREYIDRGCDLLAPRLGFDLRTILYPADEHRAEAAERLDQTALSQPALFITSHALARLWISWGLRPEAMIGHSIGEYVAACLAGVLSLDDALATVWRRGALMQDLPAGAMMAVQLPEHEVGRELPVELSIAAINAPNACVVSGPLPALAAFHELLSARGVACRRLSTSHAFHSAMMDGAVEEFRRHMATITLRPPRVPFISNLTGTWISDAEAIDPDYWARHLRQTVRFGSGIEGIADEMNPLFLEVGPRSTLANLTRQGLRDRACPVVASAGRSRDGELGMRSMAEALAGVWLAGMAVDWNLIAAGRRRRRIPLPTYPFERQRYWIDPLPERPAAPLPLDAATGDAEMFEVAPDSTPSWNGVAKVQPISPLEQSIAGVFRDVLGTRQIGPHDDFYELGGTSLLAVNLAKHLSDTLEVSIAPADVLGASTPAALAAVAKQRMRRSVGEEAAGRSSGTAALNLPAEVVLDPAIRPQRLLRHVSEQEAVLLTGATGFLGAFMLHELLRQTTLTVYCLVRAPSTGEATQRLRENLERYGLPFVWPEGRVVAVVGDLAQPLLGLSDAGFMELSAQVDAICHCGAVVNHAVPYAALKAANVAGTHEVLRLAGLGTAKPVHLVSTSAVFDIDSYPPDHVFAEDDPLEHWEGIATGYGRSKWVAEKLAAAVRPRGIPVSIYRSGALAGASQSGACSLNDTMWRMLKGCVQLGVAPDLHIALRLPPIDYVSRAIVYLSRLSDQSSQTYHLANPVATTWRDLVEWTNATGYPVRLAPYAEWRTTLERECAADNPLVPLLATLSVDEPDQDRELVLDDATTRRRLAGSDIECPPLNRRLFDAHLNYFQQCGFLPTAPIVSSLGGRL